MQAAHRPRHPSKEIEAAIQYAEERGWRYKKTGNSAHAWGRLLCPHQEREGCGMSIPKILQNAKFMTPLFYVR
ncbi:MAG: hypothetical protein HKM04_11330 [Legionellales bacterium]|nr:hypothetical protein [Legionellales bacterium]